MSLYQIKTHKYFLTFLTTVSKYVLVILGFYRCVVVGDVNKIYNYISIIYRSDVVICLMGMAHYFNKISNNTSKNMYQHQNDFI